jgi:hypothetical protein
LDEKNIRIRHQRFAAAKVSTDDQNSNDATERNVMSIVISKLPIDTLSTLKLCFTELVTASIERYMGKEIKMGKKKSWKTSSVFVIKWGENNKNLMIQDNDNTTIIIRNIFDSKETADIQYYKIPISTEFFEELIIQEKNCTHTVKFFNFVKLELIKLVANDVNLLNFIDPIEFQMYQDKCLNS